MARARLAALAALVLVLVAAPAPTGMLEMTARLAAAGPLAAVAWPPSSGLLVAEVVTGGASASDEYIELTNGGATPQDLNGLEVVYVTSSGATVTRKAAWMTPVVLDPGRHLLLANTLGAYAALADAGYSGGLAATGGSIVLRAIGGSPIDAVGWGDATNVFVEGTAVGAPGAGSSIERGPGGDAGNVVDTNDNAADFQANATPLAQNLAAAPVPSPSASAPTATATPSPITTASPTPEPTPLPSAPPTPEPTPSPSPEPTPSATPSPTPTATPAPTATPMPSAPPTPTSEPTPSATPEPTVSPTPLPTPEPTPVPSPEPTPSASPEPTIAPTPVTAIAIARAVPDGSSVTVEGTLTTALGALESGRTGFIQDATAGIALYLDVALPQPIPAATLIRVGGTLDSRYGQRTLRIAGSDIEIVGAGELPSALQATTGAAGEPLEGLRLELTGMVVDTPSDLADGLGLSVDDGTGAVRIVVAPEALAGAAPTRDTVVTARGPLGQRDSGGTGLVGYRLYATQSGEFEIVAVSPSPAPSQSESPSPSASPTPSESAAPTETPAPSPSPSPSATPSPTPTPPPTPSPSPTPVPLAADVASARAVPVGQPIAVRGVVIAEAGRLGTPPLFAIGDATGGLPIRLPEEVRGPARGTLVEVRGTIASPYGQTELRAFSGGVVNLGTGALPTPLQIDPGDVGESAEGRLAVVRGTVSASAAKATSGDIALTITGDDGQSLRVYADASAGMDATALRKGLVATFTGVVGQHASRKGALDGYRLWLRDPADVAVISAPAASPSPLTSASPAATTGPVIPIAAARSRDGARVTVEGVLTVDRSLLDASGRLTIVEDATGAIELFLPTPDTAVHAGLRVRVTGIVGRAYGASRLRTELVRVLGDRTPVPRGLAGAPVETDEWRLVRATGTIVDVHRLGGRWVAELAVGATRIPVIGLDGSGIPPATVVEGRRATVTGIVRRPYPTATDRRFSIVPRGSADLDLGPAAATRSAAGRPAASAAGPAAGTPVGASTAIADVDLVRIADHLGEVVRVGGLVTALEPDGVRIDDGTAIGRLVLAGDAARLVALLEPGDALNAVGRPEQREEIVLVVTDPAALVLGADPGSVGAGAGATPTGSPPLDRSNATLRAAISAGGGLDPASMGIGTLALVSAMSVLVTLARRHRGRRMVQARIMSRIEAFARPAATPPGRGPRAPG